jgi:hypothetical protein
LVAAVIAATPAQAYYHYIHYLNGDFGTPVYEKFDLSPNGLPNKTVTFFVTDTGAKIYGTNDDFASVLSQIQQAAVAWNSVDSSDLRVAFGGLESQGQVENGPGGDVVFVDLPPGLLGLGGTNVPATETPVNDANGKPFFPITRSIIQLTDDTAEAPGPSYLESFFTTAVHEMGHALGLQHTWTSAAMAQDIIRNTSRARPIDADDRAGLSVLYGKANWTSNFGSISGRVTANGQPVALASVVAIPPAGPAVSALTNPDGTYTINGLPVSTAYLLYVHPLPPDAIVASNGSGLRLPVDQIGQPKPASGAFTTVFYPGTNDPNQATSFNFNPGSAATGQNFSVNPESAVSMYDIVTYSYGDSPACAASATPNCWNSPAYVNSTAAQFTIEARASQPLVTPVPQSVTILGGFGTASLCAAQNAILPCFEPYNVNTGQRLPTNTTDPNAGLAIFFSGTLGAGIGPRHLLFTMPNGDLYILPDGVNLVKQGPPAIASVTPNGDGTVTIAGSNFATDNTLVSRVFFDGQPVPLQSGVSVNASQDSITVVPPPGYSGQNASVIVYNSDGQNSTFYQPQSPPTYSYAASAAPQITVSLPSLPSGVSAAVDIKATNMQFCVLTAGGCVNAQVTLGFGTSDVSVRRVWVLSPTHLVANLVVASNAAIGFSEISVVSGFQVASQAGGFQITPADPTLPFLGLPLQNDDPYQQTFYPGAIVSLFGSRLATAPNSAQLTLTPQAGGNAQSLQSVSIANQVNFVIPSNFPPGPAVLNLNNGATNAPPIELQIDGAPPVIQQILGASGQPLDASHLASSGDTLMATVSNVDPSVVSNPSRVQVALAGISQNVTQVNAGTQSGTVTVSFVVSQSFSGAIVPVVVAVGGVASDPASIIVK